MNGACNRDWRDENYEQNFRQKTKRKISHEKSRQRQKYNIEMDKKNECESMDWIILKPLFFWFTY